MTHFVNGDIYEITNSAQAAKCDSNLHQKYHFDMIANDGIFFLPGKLGAISSAHSRADIKNMISASTRFSENIQGWNSLEELQMADKKKKFSNSKEEYNDALATADPTKIGNVDLEKLAKEAMKKFKSLS